MIMGFERQKYKSFDYLVWRDEGTPRHPGIANVSLVITASNLRQAIEAVADIHRKIKFDALILEAAKDAKEFDKDLSFEAFAPHVAHLTVKESCGRVDFSRFEVLRNLAVLSTLIAKPKQLRLAAFPKLWHATLGQIDRADVLEGARSLQVLRLFRRLHLNQTGWQWLETMAGLRELVLSQFEMISLEGIPSVPSIVQLTVAHPRGLKSLAGIEGLANLEDLEIDGARQIESYAALGSLKSLRHLSIIESQAPESEEFLHKLPELQSAMINGREIEFGKKNPRTGRGQMSP